jgi:breast cancer 2 susceptibility protein
MSQQQSGFLYTQMTQPEPEFNSFSDSAIGKGNRSSERTITNVTTHGYTRKQEEPYCNPENAIEKAKWNYEPDFSTNETKAPLDVKQSPDMPSKPMLDRIGNSSRIQVSKQSLQKADELLRKETTPTCFDHCTFQTAGKGAVISVTEENLSRATALLQDASAEVDSLGPLRNFSSTSTSCQLEALFHTAGKKSVISVSEDSMARATALLQCASVSDIDIERKKSSQPTSSFSASAPQFATAFGAAGKKAVVSATEDSRTWANTLRQEATAADEPKIYSIPVASGPPSAAVFQTAGTGSLISVKDANMTRATAMLKDTMAANGESEPFSTCEDPPCAPRRSSQLGAMFQSAGEGSVIAVSEDSIASVMALPQKESATALDVDREATTQALSSRSTRAPQYAVAFHTAGKKSVISVTEEGMARANILLQDATITDVETSPQARLLPVAENSELVVMFQTAGTASVISAQEESTTRATALLQDKSAATSEVMTCSLSRDLSSWPTSSPYPGSMFQTAGKGTVISVSDVSMERATALLQDSSVTLEKARANESSQAVSSVSTNAPHFAAMFHTAGKKNVVSVTEDGIMRAKALFQNERATDVEPLSKMGLSSVANGPEAIFRTAGKGSGMSLQEESKALASALLEDKLVATGEVDTYLLSQELSSAPTILSQSRSMFQTAGKRTVISVSDDSMERATALLQDSSVVIAEAGTKQSSDALSASTSAPQFTATFYTAGKNVVVSITDDESVHANALLQETTATDVDQASHIYSQSAIKFQTAGRGSVIDVKEESMAWATTLLEVKSACSAQADPKKLPQDLLPESQSCSPQAVAFQAAGSGNMVSFLEDRLEPAKVVLQNTSPADGSTNMIEPSQDGSSATASISQPLALFQTAGKGTVVSVTDDSIMKANTLLHDAATTDVNDLAQPSVATSYPGLVASFQSAGKGSVVLTEEERMAWGKALLEDTPDSYFEADLKEPPRELSSIKTIYPESAAILQTRGQGGVVSVLEQNLTRASKVLHGDMMWSSSASSVKKRTRIDAFDECRAEATDDATKECNSRFARTSCDYILDTDEGTQAVPLETPLLLYRHEQSESLPHKAIRSAALELTPQSQHTSGNLVPRRQQAFDTSPETYFESPDDVRPQLYTDLANQATPASRLIVSRTRKRRVSLSQPTLANPAFTPKQTPAAITSAAVTMSVDPKNPYLRNGHNNPNGSPNVMDAYSPVPINFRHCDGSFRGKVISPSSISYAESVLSRRRGDSGNELKKLPVSAHSCRSTLLDSRTKKKVVTWSEDTARSDRVPTRTTLSNFAAEYGKMNDCISAGLNAGIHPVALAVDSNNAAQIRFDAESELPCSFFGQACPPNCTVVGSVKDLRASLVSRGCEEKNLVDKWIVNHYRWIVWKLASMERRFASSLAQSYLTYDHVVTQLEKRYERELKDGERSALRKVLNRDVAANSMMILCVCQTLPPIKGKGTDTKSSKHDECYVELTDGWYSIRGVLDASLSANVRNRKIKVGTKLLICNGRLEGSEEGVDPLDPSYSCSGQNCSIALYLSANGTRLANWDAKMGFVKPSQYIRSTRGSLLVRSISHIIPGGGNVPLIDVIVCRLYPRMFLERKGMSDPSDSSEAHSRKSPVISEVQEYRNQMDFEKKRQQAIERLSETIQNECAKVKHHPRVIPDYQSIKLCRSDNFFLIVVQYRKWTRWHQSYGRV